jgi:putative inorganic carbon (HCO3(-)) transporter
MTNLLNEWRTGSESARLEVAGAAVLMACLGIGTFTIWGANLVAAAGILWAILAWREGRRPDVPAFFWPLVAFAAWTLLSCALSLDPEESFKRSRQLLFFLVVPGTVRLLRGERAMTAINVIVAFGAASALFGIVQYAALGYDIPDMRPRGTFGHWMTWSGVLMLVACCAAARLIFPRRQWIWPAIAVPSLAAALVFSNTRNAWIGTALGVGTLLAVRQVKLLLLAPVAALLLYFVAPAGAQQRALSIFDPGHEANRDRVGMLISGTNMVRDHPVFGIGWNMVESEFPKYRTAYAVDPHDQPGASRKHLHNVPMQLAAERGLPALALWLWFVVVAARDLFRQLIRGPEKTVAAAGVAALVAMLAAGMFEHNFGDSEFLMLFLEIISLPYAASRVPPLDFARGDLSESRRSRAEGRDPRT